DAGGRLALGERDRVRVAAGLGGHGLAQEGQVPDGPDRLDPVAVQQRHARGVIAAVLQPLEALEKELATRPVANVSNDPAHVSRYLAASFPWSVRLHADAVSQIERAARRAALIAHQWYSRNRALTSAEAAASEAASAQFPLHDLHQAGGDLFAFGLVGGLHHHPHHGLGAGGPDQHPAAAVQLLGLALDGLPDSLGA